MSNFVISFFSIYVAVFLSNPDFLYNLNTIFIAISGALIGGGGMVINDYFDFEIDKINRPERAIPSGLITRKSALIYYILLNVAGVLFSALTHNIMSVIICIVSIPIILFYSYKLKRLAIIGNITVSFMTGLAFVFGASITSNFKAIIFPAIFAFLLNWAREILKDIEDMEGDKLNGVKSQPIVFGIKNAVNTAVMLLILVSAMTIVPYWQEIYKIEYFIIVMIFVNIPVVLIIKALILSKNEVKFKSLQLFIKLLMPIGLLSFLLGTK